MDRSVHGHQDTCKLTEPTETAFPGSSSHSKVILAAQCLAEFSGGWGEKSIQGLGESFWIGLRYFRAREMMMAQWIKAPAIKPDVLSPVPGTHIWKEKSILHRLSPLTITSVL